MTGSAEPLKSRLPQPPTFDLQENLPPAHPFCVKIVSLWATVLPANSSTSCGPNLEHFDQTGHIVDSETVAEIKHRLRVRIAEVESELRSQDKAGAD